MAVVANGTGTGAGAQIGTVDEDVGGPIIVGSVREPTSFNVNTIDDDNPAGVAIMQSVWPTCTRLTPSYEHEPVTCERLPRIVATDPFTVEYRLRSDAVWSDGTPVSAADLRFVYENCNDAEDDCARIDGYDQVSEFVEVDERTVQLTFSTPYPAYRALFSTPMPPAHVAADWSTGFIELTEAVLSAGPFQIESWDQGSDLVLVPNPTYWGDRPRSDSVVWRFLSDDDELVPALSVRDVDVIQPPVQLRSLMEVENLDGIAMESTVGPAWEHLTFNVSGPHLVAVDVREAVALAIDRQAILDVLIEPLAPGAEVLGSRVFVVGHEDYLDNTPTALRQRNAARARLLLERAGYVLGEDGVFVSEETGRLSLILRTTAGDGRREAAAEFVQFQLAEAGFEVTIDAVEPEVFVSEGPGTDFDLTLFAWLGSPVPVLDLGRIFTTGGASNFGGYSDERVDELLALAAAEVDATAQARLLNEADDAMWETLPSVPLYQLPSVLAYDNRINGIVDNPTGAGFAWDMASWRWAAE